MTEEPEEYLVANSLPVQWSAHVIDRFIERLRPGVGRADAHRQLCRFLATARVTRRAPEWVGRRSRADRWLLLGDDFACPLHRHGDELLATTLLCRGALIDESRERRNAGKARRRAGRAAARKVQKRRVPHERPSPDPGEWGEEAA